jgi:transketolase
VGNAVGLAIGQLMAAARYNTPERLIVSARVFGICSDGDLMEGVASEAASLAGHLGLGNLNLIYDDNHITIEGDTALAFSEDVAARFARRHVQHRRSRSRGDRSRATAAVK